MTLSGIAFTIEPRNEPKASDVVPHHAYCVGGSCETWLEGGPCPALPLLWKKKPSNTRNLLPSSVRVVLTGSVRVAPGDTIAQV